MIFFQKRIKGTVISCEGFREWFLSIAPIGCRLIDSEYLYEPKYNDMNDHGDCFAFYRSVILSYVLYGNVKRLELNDVLFPRQYTTGDSIMLIYNKLNRTIRVKD